MPEIGSDDGRFAAEQADSAANAHRGDRRVDLHALAGVSDLSGDEGEGAFHQAEDRAVRRAVVGLEVIFVERHPRVVHEIKRRAVREGDPASRIGTGLDNVGLVDRIADMLWAGDAVVYERDLADNLFHFADGVRRQGRFRLRVLPGRGRAGQQVDQVAVQVRTVRRDQVGMLFGGEITGDDEAMTVLPDQDQIGTPSVRSAPGTKAPRRQYRFGRHVMHPHGQWTHQPRSLPP
jgi:hypothetical protein